MADYNIYIHDLSSGSSGQNPTQAWQPGESATPTQAWNPKPSESGSGLNVSTVGNALSKFKSMGAAGKFGAVVLAAYAVVKTCQKIVDTVEPFVTRETGDYRFNVAWNNSKACINAVTHPLQSAINYAKYQQEARLYNEKQEQSRLLIGESITNNPKRRI